MPKSELTSEGLKNSLKSYDLKNAIVEYVWNGCDANATRIYIEQELNELGGTTKIKIKDNGCGIDFNQLHKKFGPPYVSEKKNKNIKKNPPKAKTVKEQPVKITEEKQPEAKKEIKNISNILKI